jgi:hypothetical protein
MQYYVKDYTRRVLNPESAGNKAAIPYRRSSEAQLCVVYVVR